LRRPETKALRARLVPELDAADRPVILDVHEEHSAGPVGQTHHHLDEVAVVPSARARTHNGSRRPPVTSGTMRRQYSLTRRVTWRLPDHSGAAKIQICTSVALIHLNPTAVPNNGSAPPAYGLLAVARQP
jgi:hypothetical protein